MGSTIELHQSKINGCTYSSGSNPTTVGSIISASAFYSQVTFNSGAATVIAVASLNLRRPSAYSDCGLGTRALDNKMHPTQLSPGWYITLLDQHTTPCSMVYAHGSTAD